ncbi:MAG: SusC/RagA family TonB-linked outer membrane protein, partial [Chitinophagaceae bacterium]
AEELTQAHTTNVTNALAGKIPGVKISGSGGSFTGSSIIIRGVTTLTGSNQPLFVVDGIPFDNSGGGAPLQTGPPVSNRAIDINQEDIENITVLKGPSAAALYGSRASNGVILITTKKGKYNQKGTVEVSTSYGIESVNRFPTYQNQYGQGSIDLSKFLPTPPNPASTPNPNFNKGKYLPASQTSWGPAFGTTATAENGLLVGGSPISYNAYPNNVRDMFKNGQNLQTNISFTGGSEKNAFRFSYGFTDNTGVLDNNKLLRHNFGLNTTSRITNRLTVSVSGNYSNNSSKRTQQGNQLSSPLFRGWLTPRSYDLTGLPFESATGDQLYPLGEDNPYWTIKNNRFKDEINRFFGNVAVNYKFTNWLQFDYKLGADVYSTFRHAYDQIGMRGQGNVANTAPNTNPYTGTGGAGFAGGVLEARNQYRSLSSNGYFTAQKRFGNFSLTGVVGNEISQTYSASDQTLGYGIVVRDFEQLSNTTSYKPLNGSTTVRLIGLYGDFTAAYKSIASLNVTLRNDWSSTFKPGNNSYLYNAVAASINFTELFPSLRNNVIENFKINANVATVGKAGLDFVYRTDSYYGAAGASDGFGPAIQFPFNSLQGFSLNDAAGNANLGPEFTTNKEIGVNLAFFKNRVSIEATLYHQNSRKLIFDVPVSNSSGIGTVTQNAGKLSNKGFELAVNVTPIRTKFFSWDINANYSQVKSTVDELSNGVTNIFLGGFTTPNIRLVAGDEYGQIYGNAYLRDAKTNQLIILPNGLPQATTGVQKIGNPNPKWLMGITNTFSYKGFSVSVLLDIRHGGDQYSRNVKDMRTNGVAIETAEFPRFNADGTVSKPYLFEGVLANGQPNTTKVSAQDYWGNTGKYVAAEGFILDASWFRIREASVSYKIPASLSQKVAISRAEISVYGRNLFLYAPNYPHLDPEQNALGISNAVGLEFNALPQTRSMGVSLRVGL